MTEIKDDHNKLVDERRKKLLSLREEGFNYPISIEIDTTIKNLFEAYGESSREEVSDANKTVKIAGRMMAKRIMGKSSFSKVVDSSGSIQLFLNSKNLDEKMYNNFKTYDVGDIIWVEGVLFRTKTDELTVNVEKIEVLSKSLRPLPEKYHGLTDTETRYRKRYLDLIMSDDSKAVFQKRSKIVTTIRAFLDQKEILEVETPMMHPIAGGAIAKPFITHHNTLDRDFFLRIAPELYLKRLVVGGLHRVYEINRSFRNEGISTKHNPEFTMLELYLAYASYEEIMTLVEDMIIDIAMALNGSTTIQYQDSEYDLSGPYKRMTLEESVIQYNPKMDPKKLRDRETLLNTCKELGIKTNDDVTTGKLLFEIFEKTVEDNLIEPTFITRYPRDVSPLSRANDNDSWLVDRFEFFIAGSELAKAATSCSAVAKENLRMTQQLSNQPSKGVD